MSIYGRYLVEGMPSWVNSATLVIMAISEKHATDIAAAHLGVDSTFLAGRPGLKVTHQGPAASIPGPCRVLQDIPWED